MGFYDELSDEDIHNLPFVKNSRKRKEQHCSKCLQPKSSLILFSTNQARICNNCKEKQKRVNLVGSKTGYAEYLLKLATNRAKQKEIECTISVEDILAVFPDSCPVLKCKFYMGLQKKIPNSPSLDKIDPSKGYIPGNIQVISLRANTIKNNASLEELESLVLHMKNVLNK